MNFISDRAFKDGFKAGQSAKASERHAGRAPRNINEAAQLCWVQGYQEGFSSTHDKAPGRHVESYYFQEN